MVYNRSYFIKWFIQWLWCGYVVVAMNKSFDFKEPVMTHYLCNLTIASFKLPITLCTCILMTEIINN